MALQARFSVGQIVQHLKFDSLIQRSSWWFSVRPEAVVLGAGIQPEVEPVYPETSAAQPQRPPVEAPLKRLPDSLPEGVFLVVGGFASASCH